MQYTEITEEDIRERDELCQPLKLGESASMKKARESITYWCYHQLGIKPYVWQHKFFKELTFNDRDILINTPRQLGKEQPYSSKIITPNGWTAMGELKVGDYVYSEDGTPTKVLNTFEQGEKDVYRITFTDESEVECGLEHLWKVKRSGAVKWKELTLGKIIKEKGMNPTSDNAYRIPLTQPVQFKENKHFIHPYVLGALIGDGTLTQGSIKFTTGDTEILEYFKSYNPDIEIKQVGKPTDYSLYSERVGVSHKLIKELERLDLRGKNSLTKHIPNEYLYDSVDNRINLLKGLMDTDGTIYGQVMEYYTISPELAEQVKELVQGLGGTARIRTKPAWYKDKDGNRIDCNICYRVKIKMQYINPFELSRKANKWRPIKYKPHRIIKSIELVRKEKSKCIFVEHDSHTYLTDNYIVTHNSFSLAVSSLHAVMFNTMPIESKGNRTIIGIASKSEGQAKKLIEDIRSLIILGDQHVEKRYGVKNFFSAHLSTKQVDTNNKTAITFRQPVKDPKTKQLVPEGKVIGQIVCTPATDSARGYTFSRFCMDEAAFFEDEEFYDTIAEPTLRATRGHAVVTTTPNGQRGWFYSVFDPEDTLSKNYYYRMWLHYNHIENEDELKDIVEKKMPKAIAEGTIKRFQQEYEAMFTADDISFFDSEKVDLGVDYSLERQLESKESTDMGIDFGFKTCNTVITITKYKDDKAQLVWHKIYPPEGDLDIYDDVIQLLPIFNVNRVIVDECPAASSFIQRAEKEGRLNMHKMSFKRDKQTKYFQFRQRLYEGKIKYYEDKRLLQEMKGMVAEEQKIGTRISKPSGGSDDFIDSFLMSCYFYIEDKRGGKVIYYEDDEDEV